MTGPLTLSADPTTALEAATKQYVDGFHFVPIGTVMVFYQATAPVGWTQVVTHNDKLLRVVSGAGGGAGGTNTFSSVNAQTVVGSHTLSNAEMTYHNHGGQTASSPSLQDLLVSTTTIGGAGPYGVNSNQTHLHGIAADGGNAAHNHTIAMAIQYIDMIIASKN
jgi:hypothetical protein